MRSAACTVSHHYHVHFHGKDVVHRIKQCLPF
jgi:hypothetical protein